jgi:hypothetical protein
MFNLKESIVQPTQMSVEDLRNSVDIEHAVRIIEKFQGEPNIKALATISCALGTLLGAEAGAGPGQLTACIAAISFIMYDAAQLAMREGKTAPNYGAYEGSKTLN